MHGHFLTSWDMGGTSTTRAVMDDTRRWRWTATPRRCVIGMITVMVMCRAGWAHPRSLWKAHDPNRPRPPVVTPAPQKLPVDPPEDAVVLFDGTDLRHWNSPDGGPARWIVRDGYMEAQPDSGGLVSARSFGDVQLHLEWASPTPAEGHGQERGNSGVFLMRKYEVQILDSFENDTYADGQAAAIYGQYPPLVNACRPPGEWQSFDIFFRRPRFQRDGKLAEPARVTVVHNGILVQDHVQIWGPTMWLQHLPYQPHPDKLPLALQEHGNPVRYRNIWLRELAPWDPTPPPPIADDPVVYLGPDVLKGCAGRYATGSGDEFVIGFDGMQLQVHLDDERTLDLVPHSPDRFSMRWTAGEVVFRRNANGRATSLVFESAGSKITARRAD